MNQKAANLQDTGADKLTIQRNLNSHGAQRWEHYAVSGIIGFFRESDLVWEYKVEMIYGNSVIITDKINAIAREGGWIHYLTEGTQGYFKRPVAKVETVLPEVKVEPVVKINDAPRDKTGMPQLPANGSVRRAAVGRR